MVSLLLLVWYLILLALIGGFLYTLGTYLLRKYDMRLAAVGELEPDYAERNLIPQGFDKWQGIGWEMLSTAAFIGLFPFGIPGKRSLPASAQDGCGAPILLIHGFNHNRSAWIPFKRRLRRARLGPLYSLNLRSRSGTIEEFAELVAKESELIAEETGTERLILVGHSMGGVVAAYYAEHLAKAGTVSHVITLGSPLKGTRTAVLNGAPVTKQMRPRSEFIDQLSQAIASSTGIEYYHVASRLDNIIFPYQSALLGKHPEREYIVSNVGHMTLLFSPTVARRVIDWLRQAVGQEEAASDSTRRDLSQSRHPSALGHS